MLKMYGTERRELQRGIFQSCPSVSKQITTTINHFILSDLQGNKKKTNRKTINLIRQDNYSE